MTAVLLALWLCQVHVVDALGLFALFLLAVCTSVFYGVLFWTIYLALEPFVRRHWPQSPGVVDERPDRPRPDAVVGRDVLIGVALGIWFALLFRASRIGDGSVNYPGDVELLLGLRSTVGVSCRRRCMRSGTSSSTSSSCSCCACCCAVNGRQ